MPIIKCEALDCLHNSKGYCDVIDECQVDINTKGECIDHTSVTDEEYKTIMGKERSK